MPFQPIMLNDSTLTIDSESFEVQVSSAVFTPSGSTVTWKGLTPTSKYSFSVPADWTLDLGYAQDWEFADALSRFLHEHEGENLAAVFSPNNGGATVSATISIAAGPIGGEVGTVAVGTVSMGSTKPVVSALAP